MSVEPRTRSATPAASTGHEPANLGDILERVLDRGLVIVGDIRISLLDIELLTVKLRLLIASVDTARELGIDWWEHDPWLSSRSRTAIPPGRDGYPEVTEGGYRTPLGYEEEQERTHQVRGEPAPARALRRSPAADEADLDG
jgi:Gas vesicle protein